ncbi:hypothetical protein [Anaerobaca lacustris]|uniref:DUF87 domain-containing protein n=1 Tax=Anaerobaca lacustris TaxID=3044600 RepID=A0AAW6TWZ3_9BACT|nr:hypothetical protein [Sedimentisphaerales bacterium M17dextr]
MGRNKDPSTRRYLFEKPAHRFTSLEPDEQLLALEAELRRREKLHDPYVQWLIEKAAMCSDTNRQWARDQLRMVIEADRIEDMRTGDAFRPLAPPQLLGDGDLHLLDQVDGVPWKVPWTALPRGLLVTGPQGAGKTRLMIWLCKQLNAANPPIPWFLVDPKLEFKNWASHLGAIYIDAERPDIGIDLSPPPGLTYETWLPSLVPQIGEIVGVIYGTEILQQAAQICIELRDRYMSQSGRSTEICLQDLNDAIPLVRGASSWRRGGYRDAVLTGLSRILSGGGNLFKCRRGIDLNRLFGRNVVFGTRSVTDDFATRFLALYLLWYLQEAERHAAPTQQPKSVLIIDDASRYIGAREGSTGRALSSIGSILTTMRSSGRCFVAVSQIPHLIDPGVCALMHTVVDIGGLHHAADTQLLARMMGLTEPQRQALTSLGQREAVGLCGGSAWPRAVHGRVPEVADPTGVGTAQATDLPELETEPYTNLPDLVQTHCTPEDSSRPAGEPPATVPASPATPDHGEPSSDLAANEKMLALDIVTSLASTLRQRQQRLGLSARQLEDRKQALVNKGLIVEVPLGKALMLAPTQQLYRLLGIECPYKRNAWEMHSFLVLLAAKLIESDPLVKSVKTEVSLGDANSTVDLIGYLHDGERHAFEVIHRTVTNIAATAAKLEGKAFSQVRFLCSDFNIKERVWATLRNAGFGDEFLATIRCDLFGALLRAHQGRRKNA